MTTLLINLIINGANISVPVKTRITRGLLRTVEPVLATLHAITTNKSMQEAVLKNISVMELMDANGSFNERWRAKQQQELLATFPEMDDAEMQRVVASRFVAELKERYPDVYDAMMFPTATLSVSDSIAMDAAIELIKIIINVDDLTQEQRDAMTNESFWDEQDLTEVVAIVNKFRDLLQHGAKEV